MGQINLANSKGRDAVVNTQSVTVPLQLRWVDQENRQVNNSKILKSSINKDIDILVEQAGALENVSDILIDGDPEIDMETFGSFLRNTARVYIDPEGKVAHRVKCIEILKNPDGNEKERRPKKTTPPNVATDTPLKWSGKLIKKEDAYNRFVFSSKIQITHYNGLTYDFLYEMAKELESQKSLMLIGAGSKSNQPLVFRRGSISYRGFLEGRTQGNKYALILHLSNMELKAPEKQ